MNDIIKYNCSLPIDKNADFNNIVLTGDYRFKEFFTEFIPYYSSIANKTSNNIADATDNGFYNVIVIYDINIIEVNDLTFNFECSMLIKPSKIQITFYIDEDGKGNLINASCTYILIENEKYEFDCVSNKSINAPSNSVIRYVFGWK